MPHPRNLTSHREGTGFGRKRLIDCFEILLGSRSTSRAKDISKANKSDAGQNADNGDNHQEFDEGKTFFSFGIFHYCELSWLRLKKNSQV